MSSKVMTDMQNLSWEAKKATSDFFGDWSQLPTYKSERFVRLTTAAVKTSTLPYQERKLNRKDSGICLHQSICLVPRDYDV